MNMKIDFAGMAQVNDEIWICGGNYPGDSTEYSHSKSCTILNLVNGTSRVLKWKMNYPRLKSTVSFEGNKGYC